MKVKEFQGILREKKVDAALFLSLGMEPDPNFFYFTGYEGAGALIMPKAGRPTLLAPKMEMERAARSRIKTVRLLEKKKLFDSIAPLLKGKKTVGIDGRGISLSMFRAFKKSTRKKPVDISAAMGALRTVKTAEEQGLIRKSCAYADAIIQKCISNFKEFKTESDAAAFLQYETFRRGLDVSFKPIVASGKNGSMPHHTPQNTKLGKGLCVIDFGVKYKGYCSDITRTVGIKKVSPAENRQYAKLLTIQKNSVSSITEGMKCSALYANVVEALGKDAEYFTHGLGHGIGVEIHELPNLTANSPDTLQRHMAFTVEPGVYYPGKFGIRIEDSILFSKKPEQLTKTAKELIIL